MLRHVRSVQVIVVLDAALVLVVDLNDERQEFVVIDNLEQIVELEEWSGHEWHLHVTTDRLREIEYVEGERVDALIELLVAFYQLLDVFGAEVEIDSISVDLDRAEVTSRVVLSTIGGLDRHERRLWTASFFLFDLVRALHFD